MAPTRLFHSYSKDERSENACAFKRFLVKDGENGGSASPDSSSVKRGKTRLTLPQKVEVGLRFSLMYFYAEFTFHHAAHDQIDRILALDPDNLKAKNDVVRLHYLHGKHHERHGEKLLAEGYYAKGLEASKKLLSEDDHDGMARYGVIICAKELGKFDEATMHCHELNKQTKWRHNDLVEMEKELGGLANGKLSQAKRE